MEQFVNIYGQKGKIMKIYYSILGLALFSLVACSPRYKIEKIYIPPKNNLKCVEKCKQEKYKCEKECESKKKSCLDKAIIRSKRIYTQQEKIYQKRLEVYFKQYDRYLSEYNQWRDKFLRLNEDYQYYSRKCSIDKSWCDERDYYKKILDNWIKLKPKKPIKPKEPSFNKILKEQQSLCLRDCCCNTNFDICFQSCGGKVLLKKICVENCD